MNVSKRMIRILLVVTALIGVLLFAFACNDMTLDEPRVTEEPSAPTAATEDSRGEVEDRATESGAANTDQQGADTNTSQISDQNQNQSTDQNAPQSTDQNATEESEETQTNEQNTTDTEEPQDVEDTEIRCPVCDALMRENGAHEAACDYYAVIPIESEAHDFLDAFHGVRENLTVTCLDEEIEIYSFELNYLTEEGATALERVMLDGGTCIPRGNASNEYHLQKVIGSKVYTITVNLTIEESHYKATVNLTGYSLES